MNASTDEADGEDLLVGQEAVDYVADTWNDIGQGKVELEIMNPWLVARRKGGDYTFFLSLVDDTAVTILDDNAATTHIPDEHRPDAVLDAEVDAALERAFTADAGGGTYPLPDEGVWSFNFKDGDGREQIKIGLLSPKVIVDGERIDPEGRDDD